MRFQSERRLAEVGLLARQNGKTYTLILGMKANPGAQCIVRTRLEKKILAQQYDIDPKRFICMHDLEKLRGIQRPVVIDPFAVQSFIHVFEKLDEYESVLRAAVANPKVPKELRKKIMESLEE